MQPTRYELGIMYDHKLVITRMQDERVTCKNVDEPASTQPKLLIGAMIGRLTG